MSYQQQQHQQRRRFIPPEVGSIHRATVTRIEPYGCFVKFINDNTDSSSPINISGLVHISQLTAITNNGVKISDVNDVVSLNDEVYVKVMDVTIEQTEDGRQRHKLKLSMKYVHQDTGQDLDPDGELMEQDLMRSSTSRRSGGSNIQHNANEDYGTGGANSLLGRSLASNIGISSAIDPGSLILKGRKSSGSTAAGAGAGSTNFNGYLLVGEDEGEVEAPTTSIRDDEQPSLSASMAPAVRPMGRGRATTLPAWMTRQDDNDDRLGSMKDEKGPGGRNDDDNEDDSSSRGDRHRKKKRSSRRDDKHHKHHKDRKHHRSNKRSSSSRKHSRKHKKSSSSRHHRSTSRGRSRSESYDSTSSSDDDDDEYHSRSRSRSPPSYKKKKKKKSKHSHRHHHRGDRQDYSRRRSRSRSDDSRDYDRERRLSSPSPSEFANVEEARAIIERLERRQRDE
jgi:predicted RNA-binding protein with RPS1 domain